MQFDPDARIFYVSVRELAEEETFNRIGFQLLDGWNRLGFGNQMHARIRNRRMTENPGYRSEVALQARIAVDDWVAVLSGRLDGCVEEEDGAWSIEEFKLSSATHSFRDGDVLSERHRRQLLGYCYLWSLERNTAVRGRLIYVDAASNREQVVPVKFDRDEQERQIVQRLATLLAIWRAESASRARKAALAPTLPFPHENVRPGQVVLMDAVRQCLGAGDHLLAEAPTGSGKTAAALHPAVAAGLASAKQVVFLTSKTLQQRMAVSAVIGMNREGLFRTGQIRAKEKMCANGQVICHEDFCPYAKDYPGKMKRSGLLDRLRSEHAHFDPDQVFAAAKKEEVCPFEVQLELSRYADVLIADYNYVFDPAVALGHLSDEGLKDVLLLVDEAHNLPDRARAIFSPELREGQIRALYDRLLFQDGEAFDSLRLITGKAGDVLRQLGTSLSAQSPAVEIDPPREEVGELWSAWEPAFGQYLSWKREQKMAEPEDAVIEFHFALYRFVTLLNFFGPEFSCVVDRQTDGIRLALVCLDPAKMLGRIFHASASTVLLSATLSPLATLRRALGLEVERTRSICLPPPFPRENRKVMIVPQVRTTFAAREQNYGRIASLIAEMVKGQRTNFLVLFPSYRFLNAVQQRLPPLEPDLIVQRPSAPDRDKERILQKLADRPAKGAVLFAVMGGMYAEGVDYPDGLLSGVFIISPALPQLSFERELLRRYFDETEGAGFEHAYLMPGMTRVIQAAGRLIRSESDQGVIALLCNRFLQEPYASRLPADWYDESPAELISRDPARTIREFFRNARPLRAVHRRWGEGSELF